MIVLLFLFLQHKRVHNLYVDLMKESKPGVLETENQGLSGGRLQMHMLQYYSALVIATFLLVFHIPNTIAALVGGRLLYNSVQDAFRRVYHSSVFEFVLLASILVHASLGVRSMWNRGGLGRLRTLPWSTLLHRLSSLYLVVVVGIHVFFVRFGAYAPRGEGVIFTLKWAPALFVPYYSLLGICGVVHGLIGVQRALFVIAGVRLNVGLLGTLLSVGMVATVMTLWLSPVDFDVYASPYAQFTIDNMGALLKMVHLI